jgi:hypothetical protein
MALSAGWLCSHCRLPSLTNHVRRAAENYGYGVDDNAMGLPTG